jgi:starch synthase
VLEVLKTLNFRVDVIHCNDWHTAFIPVYLKTTYKDEFSNTATLLAIHNIGYQGIFDKSVLSMTGLEGALPDIDTLEINGKINFLKAGLFYSDVITTVSSNYANEILTQDFGFGLESILSDRKDRLFGIVNGIDYREWNPAEDRIIQKTYRKDDLSGKHICKKSLLSLQGMPETDNPLIGMVTRLSSQKGLDIVAEAMEEIMGTGAQVIILGKGDEYLQRVFAELQEKYYPRLSVTIGFNNTLAHKIYAGADIFLMPSRYEPCGLGQLIALRYGTIPVVRNTGGLVDTIMEYNPSVGSGTGFRFNAYSSHELSTAIQRALEFFNDEQHWLKIQRNAMSQDFSWRRSAEQYKSLYQKIVAEKTALKDRSEDLQGF